MFIKKEIEWNDWENLSLFIKRNIIKDCIEHAKDKNAKSEKLPKRVLQLSPYWGDDSIFLVYSYYFSGPYSNHIKFEGIYFPD